MIGTFATPYGAYRGGVPFGAPGANVVTTEQPSWLEALAPTAGAVVREATTDPYKKVEVLRAELRAAIARGASGRTIDVLRGKLIAAERELALYEEDIRSSREWSGLGKTAAILGIGLLGLIIFAVARRA